eukprot:scaffold347947_cov19-Prasinocladus_malaysianus.AAC.1
MPDLKKRLIAMKQPRLKALADEEECLQQSFAVARKTEANRGAQFCSVNIEPEGPQHPPRDNPLQAYFTAKHRIQKFQHK